MVAAPQAAPTATVFWAEFKRVPPLQGAFPGLYELIAGDVENPLSAVLHRMGCVLRYPAERAPLAAAETRIVQLLGKRC